MEERDAIVIGAGNAGQGAAGVLREQLERVAIVEERDVGGVCPLRGCVPKKVLVAVAEALDVIERAGRLSIDVAPPRIDWGAVIERKEEILSGTSASMEKDLAAKGIELVRGPARFTGSDQVAVGERTLRAPRIVIATGSRPRPLSFPGAELLAISDDLLEMREPPQSMVFVGAGVVAFELGHVYARLGTRVTLLEVAPRPLGNFDEDAVARLVAVTGKLGIEVHAGVRIDGIDARGDQRVIRYHDAGGRDGELACAIAVNGAGRVADVDRLDPAAAGVDVAKGAVVTGALFTSRSNPGVYIAGDALAGTPQLSPVATWEGRLAARAALGQDVQADYDTIPSAVFSVPALAQVGLTAETASKRGLRFDVKVNDMNGWRSGRTYAERDAWAKLLVGDGGRILGATLLGHGAAEVINLIALAMRAGVTGPALAGSVWAYPTFSSDLKFLV
ncbi:MAG TPA: NAD(P)/FAD-dependent oxidoreductase [Kofleriaceae bacterium]|nr:NAD(P)/FAD-dependent oxidoreductase [Kofleriaceae bacterium]